MRKTEIAERLKRYHLTKFRTDVLIAACSIPKGRTVSYKQLAEMSGHPGAYRAVGTALRNNPMAPTIPCHRVIKSDGSLGRYSGRGGARTKARMLIEEGARTAR